MVEEIGKQFIWQGFNIRWENYPHRLSVFGSRFNNYQYRKKELSAYHDLHTKIGNFPGDALRYSIPYCGVETGKLFLAHGRTKAIKTRSKRNKDANKKMTIECKLDDLETNSPSKKINAKEYTEASILINGFYVEAKNNVSGWHFGGLGIQLGNIRWTGKKSLSFDVNLHIRASSAPEPFEHGNKNKKGEAWSESDPCIYSFEIDYCIVLGKPENMIVMQESVAHEVERKYQTHWEEDLVFKQADLKRMFSGIQGFKVCIHPQNSKAKSKGRYFRELGVFLSDVENKKGRYACKTNVKFSNRSYPTKNLSANPWKLEASLSVVCIGSRSGLKVAQGELKAKTGKTSDRQVMSNRMVF